MRRSKLRTSKIWKSRCTSILSKVSSTALATPRHSIMCPKGQHLSSLSDDLSVISPYKVYTKCHGMMLTSMMGLTWASTVISPIEHGRIVEGILVQMPLEKHLAPSDCSTSTTSSNCLWRGSGEEGGTIGLREGSVRRLCNWLILTEESSSLNWASWRFEVFWMFPKGSTSLGVRGSGEGSIDEYWDVKDESSDSIVERLMARRGFLPTGFSLVGVKGRVS